MTREKRQQCLLCKYCLKASEVISCVGLVEVEYPTLGYSSIVN